MSGPTPLDKRLATIARGLGLHPTRRRGLFEVERDDNRGSLYFAKASFSGRDFVSMNPHLAVTSKRLAAVFEPIAAGSIPEPFVHHWFATAAIIHEPHELEAWDWLAPADPTSWEAAERDLEERLVPALFDHITDERLVKCLIHHDWQDEPLIAHLVYLAILSRAIGPAPIYAQTVGRLRQVLAEGGSETPGLDWMAPGIRALGLKVPGQ